MMSVHEAAQHRPAQHAHQLSLSSPHVVHASLGTTTDTVRPGDRHKINSDDLLVTNPWICPKSPPNLSEGSCCNTAPPL